MALSKYVTQPIPSNGDVRRYLDAEFRKLQRSTDSIIDTTSSITEALADHEARLDALEAKLQPDTFTAWTPVVRGSTTAGTYPLLANRCRYRRIGNMVNLEVGIDINSGISAGTGYMQITGVPLRKIANSLPQGSVYLGNIVRTAGYTSLSFTSFSTSTDLFVALHTGAALTELPVSTLGAGSQIYGNIVYFTDQ